MRAVLPFGTRSSKAGRLHPDADPGSHLGPFYPLAVRGAQRRPARVCKATLCSELKFSRS